MQICGQGALPRGGAIASQSCVLALIAIRKAGIYLASVSVTRSIESSLYSVGVTCPHPPSQHVMLGQAGLDLLPTETPGILKQDLMGAQKQELELGEGELVSQLLLTIGHGVLGT